MAEKTKDPTKKKLQDSREKGQVAHSPVVVRFVASIALLEMILATRNAWLPALMGVVDRPLAVLKAAPDVTPDLLGTILLPMLSISALLVLISTGLAAALAIAANILQTGFVFAPKSMPKWESFNAVSTATQMFAPDKFLELFLNVAKVALIGGSAYLAIYWSLDALIHLGDYSLELAFDRLLDIVAYAVRFSMVSIVLLVVLDWALKRQTFLKQMRMSIDDVKREHKDSDGDPYTKAMQRRVSREIMMAKATKSAAKADAIVTNPTHFAVALRFRPSLEPLPIVLVRGQDEVALSMIEAGKTAGIPIIRFVWLARTLYSVGREGHPIPRVALRAVAAVYLALSQAHLHGTVGKGVIELGTDPDDPAAYPDGPKSQDDATDPDEPDEPSEWDEPTGRNASTESDPASLLDCPERSEETRGDGAPT